MVKVREGEVGGTGGREGGQVNIVENESVELE